MKGKKAEIERSALSEENPGDECIPVHVDTDSMERVQNCGKHVVRVDETSVSILDFNPIYPYYKAEPIIKISLNGTKKDKHGKNAKF